MRSIGFCILIFSLIFEFSLFIFKGDYDRKTTIIMNESLVGPIPLYIINWSYFRNNNCLCSIEYKMENLYDQNGNVVSFQFYQFYKKNYYNFIEIKCQILKQILISNNSTNNSINSNNSNNNNLIIEGYFNIKNPLYLYLNKDDFKCESIPDCKYNLEMNNNLELLMIIFPILSLILVFLMCLIARLCEIENEINTLFL